MKKLGIAAIVIVGCAAIGGAAGASGSSSSTSAVAQTPQTPSSAQPQPKPSAATAMKTCLASAKVAQVVMNDNSFLSTVDIYTTIPGGFVLANMNAAKLLVAKFQGCYTGNGTNGLVTVYGADGGLLSNGNYGTK